jgi:hypothetical protein
VTSTRGFSVCASDGASTRPEAANSPPTATKMIGAVKSARSRRPERTPHRNNTTVISKIAVVPMCSPPDCAG